MRQTFIAGHANDLQQCIGYCCAWIHRLNRFGHVRSIADLGGRPVAASFMVGKANVDSVLMGAGLTLGRLTRHEGEQRGVTGSWIASCVAQSPGYYVISIWRPSDNAGHSMAVRHRVGTGADLFFDPNRGQWEGDDLMSALPSLLRPYLSSSLLDQLDNTGRCWCDVRKVS